MRTTLIKVIVILVAFIIVMFLSNLITGGRAVLHPILALALIAFIGGVWNWKPQNEKNDNNKSLQKKG